MRLRVICEYGRFPVASGGTSCFLVESQGCKVVLDMGCSSLSKLQEYTTVNDIDAIVLSHLHGDHIADFKTFTYMADIYKAQGRLNKKIKVFLPDTPVRVYDEIEDCSALDYIVIQGECSYQLNDMVIHFYELKHPVKTYGQRIESNGKVLAYTADTKLCDNLNNLIDSADMVIGDACITDKEYHEKMPHLSVKQLAEACREMGAKKLLLAHLPDKGHDAILDEAKSLFDNSELAKEGQVYYV